MCVWCVVISPMTTGINFKDFETEAEVQEVADQEKARGRGKDKCEEGKETNQRMSPPIPLWGTSLVKYE